MKPFFVSILLGIAFIGCGAAASASVCAPDTLVRITTVNITPGVAPGSFNAQPKTFYRSGSGKLRIEEAADPDNKIHGYIVISEPDIWMANLYDGTGKHIVDPGPTYNAKAPVFGMQGMPQKLTEFEFGCEERYIAANAPAAVRIEQIGGDRFNVYRVVAGADAIEILQKPGASRPSFARYYHNGSLSMMIRYDAYDTGLPDNPSLFKPPADIQYTD